MTTTIRLLSLKLRQDRGDYVSRVYPRCGNISLANTTRTSTGNYTLNKTAGYIANLVNEAIYGRRERTQTFQIDTPTNAITQNAQQQMAADALFDRALEWLGQHDTIPVFYTARVTGQDALLTAGTTIHVTTTTIVDGEAVYVIDDDFNITEARNYLNDAGMLEAELDLTAIERGIITDTTVLADTVMRAQRGGMGYQVLQVTSQIGVTPVEGEARIVGGTIDGVQLGLVEPGDAAFTTILNEGRTWLAGYTVLGGELVLVKAQGILAGELTAAAGTLDFGQAMTPNDFVILRSMYQNPYEYIKVGSQVGGTVYNITRAQGGSEAQTWPANSVWLLLGHAGDGRISLRTDSAPRISVLAQGATANSATTQALLGDLNGYYGYGSSTPGLGLGEYASGKANLVYDTANGLRLRIYDTDYIQLTNDGNALISGKLQLKGVNSALAIGDTPPSGAGTGTGLWLDKTGLHGLNGSALQFKLGDFNGSYGAGTGVYGLGLGEYAPGKANLIYDSGSGLRLRIYNTDYIQLTNSGDALIAGKLQLKGTGSALAIGTTPPASASAGTGLWLDRTGLYGLASDALQFKIDAATGALIAGGGKVKLDSSGLVLACDMTPSVTDTYDLGSLDKWWRSLYASTINSTVFAQNVQQVIGGSFLIPKNTGTLPLVGVQSDSIDFGKTMTVGDHILIKSFDEGGVPKTEYIKIGDLISGTCYGVTRDEAGAHATDPVWPDGTPYAVLGQAGNGWIQLDATTTPRMSVFTLGSAYNIQNEVYRAGNLKGNWGYGSDIYGLAVGEYASNKANMTYDPTNGLRLRIYGNEYINLTNNGNALIAGKLQLNGTASALAIGTTPPASASSGTGIWIDRTGLYALTSNAAKSVVNACGVRIAQNSMGLRFVRDSNILVDTDAKDGRIYYKTADEALSIEAPSAYMNLDVGKAGFRANTNNISFWKLHSKGNTSVGDAAGNIQLAFGDSSNNYVMLESVSDKRALKVYLGYGATPKAAFSFTYQRGAPTYHPRVVVISLKVAGSGGTGDISNEEMGTGYYINFAHVMITGWKDADGTSAIWCRGPLYKPASSYNAIYFATNPDRLFEPSGGEHFVFLNSGGQLAIRNNSNTTFQYQGFAIVTQK